MTTSFDFMISRLYQALSSPRRCILQWHISDNCNLHCKHCYQDRSNSTDLLSPGDQQRVIETFADYIKSRTNTFGQINIAGGEPFLLKNLEELIARIDSHSKHLKYGILSNGTVISKTQIALLRKFRPVFVQISIDGNQDNHDAIRGKGAYQKAIRGLQSLVENGIYTIISFTAHRKNFREFPQVITLAKKIGVNKVWTDRFIPSGNGKDLKNYFLSPEETHTYSLMIKKEQLKAGIQPFNKTIVSNNRALQFFPLLDSPYSCSAGKDLLALLSNGDIVPCRRLPIVLGNIRSSKFQDMFENKLFTTWLHRKMPAGSSCDRCFFNRYCRGGLRCLSYAVCGSPHIADPGCWRV